MAKGAIAKVSKWPAGNNAGEVIYDTNSDQIRIWTGSKWASISDSLKPKLVHPLVAAAPHWIEQEHEELANVRKEWNKFIYENPEAVELKEKYDRILEKYQVYEKLKEESNA